MVLKNIFDFGIFISHSGEDDLLLQRTKQMIELIGAIPFISSPGEHPGHDVDTAIRKMIDFSSGIIVLLTKNACKSLSVSQEIGYARKGNKPILPILMKGEKMPGIFLHGTEPLPIEDDSWDSVVKIGQEISRQRWNPGINIIDDLNKIISDMKKGEYPFKCHKGHYPGSVCNGPCMLFKEKQGIVLRHEPHEWECVIVTLNMAHFLKNYIFIPMKDMGLY